jgi:hypothetical protein
MKKRDILIYGLARGETERYTEVLLSTQCVTEAEVKAVIERASQDGFHSFRVTTYDGAPPDFTKAVRK